MSTLEERLRAAGDAHRLLKDIREIQDPVAVATLVRANGELPGPLLERLTRERGWGEDRLRDALVAVRNGTTGDVRLTKREVARLRQAARSSVTAGALGPLSGTPAPAVELIDQHAARALAAGTNSRVVRRWKRQQLERLVRGAS